MPEQDTSLEAQQVQRRSLSRLSPERRMQLAIEMSESVRAIAAAGIRARNPHYDQQEVEWALRRLLLGDALYRAAWPHAPLRDP